MKVDFPEAATLRRQILIGGFSLKESVGGEAQDVALVLKESDPRIRATSPLFGWAGEPVPGIGNQGS